MKTDQTGFVAFMVIVVCSDIQWLKFSFMTSVKIAYLIEFDITESPVGVDSHLIWHGLHTLVVTTHSFRILTLVIE